MATTITGNTIDVNTAVLNRLSTDGTIVDLQKDGTTVGSIAAVSNRLSMGTGDVGIFFDNLNDRLVPITQDGLADRDAAIDLGYNSSRFKDLYLSGGVYLGGTGSANKLDDYEEGTWTPSFVFSGGNGTASFTIDRSFYTKIGNTVIIQLYMYFSKGTASGGFTVTGLPFATIGNNYPASLFWDGGGVSGSTTQAEALGTTISFSTIPHSSSYSTTLNASAMNASPYARMSIIYQTS